MSRKLRLVALAAAGFAAALPWSTTNPTVASAQIGESPNILIIVTDDQRADPASMKVMPATRRLFKRGGVTFQNAVVTTPLCCPSRASIFSGKYAHNHGVHDNASPGQFSPADSIQRVLKDNGYRTAISGKYLTRTLVDPPHFDLWASMHGGKKYYGTEFNVKGERRTINRYVDSFIEQKAIDFLNVFEKNDDDPWFLYVSSYAPHLPAVPERKYRGTPVPPWKDNPAIKEKNLGDKPAYVRKLQKKKSESKSTRRRMLQTLKSVDDLVERVFQRLRSQEEVRDTLAIFISDNGFMWNEHGLSSKRYPYAMSVRVPLLMRWPGHADAGTVRSKIVANIDVAPTVYEATGTQPGYTVDGRSLLSPIQRDRILIESWVDPQVPAVPKWRGLWTPGNKYIEYLNGDENVVFKEYYDDADRWELTNHLGNRNPNDDPSNEPQLGALLDLYSDCAGTTCP